LPVNIPVLVPIVLIPAERKVTARKSVQQKNSGVFPKNATSGCITIFRAPGVLQLQKTQVYFLTEYVESTGKA